MIQCINNIKKYIILSFQQKKLHRDLIKPLISIFICLTFGITGLLSCLLLPKAQPVLALSALSSELSEELLRFHVIANSDTDYDQQIKLRVKEEVIQYLSPYLKESESKQESITIINGMLPQIESVANHVLENYPVPYHATVSVSRCTFPIKSYGDIVLPAGEYDALRIKLGAHKGKNWWCIIFPNLCYVDATYQIVPDESKQQLKNVLTEEEYNAILQKEPKVVIKFKLVDWFRNLFS